MLRAGSIEKLVNFSSGAPMNVLGPMGERNEEGPVPAGDRRKAMKRGAVEFHGVEAGQPLTRIACDIQIEVAREYSDPLTPRMADRPLQRMLDVIEEVLGGRPRIFGNPHLEDVEVALVTSQRNPQDPIVLRARGRQPKRGLHPNRWQAKQVVDRRPESPSNRDQRVKVDFPLAVLDPRQRRHVNVRHRSDVTQQQPSGLPSRTDPTPRIANKITLIDHTSTLTQPARRA